MCVTIYKVPLNRLGHGDEIWQVHYYIVYAIESVCARPRARSRTSLSRVWSLTLKQSGGQIHNRMRVLYGACARNRWWHHDLITGPQIWPPGLCGSGDPQTHKNTKRLWDAI
jgi:hypothetical protein